MANEGILQRINEARAAQGLGGFKKARDLELAARKHAEHMAEEGFLDHRGFADRVPQHYAIASENIARHSRGIATAEFFVEGWLDSPGHRKNIMGPFTHIGIAVVPDTAGRWVYAVTVFGG